jgi:hypothetical protein
VVLKRHELQMDSGSVIIECELRACQCVENTCTVMLVSVAPGYIIKCQLCTFAISFSLIVLANSLPSSQNRLHRTPLPTHNPLAYLSKTGHTKIERTELQGCWT